MRWIRWLAWCGIGVWLPLWWPAWTQMASGMRVLDARMQLEDGLAGSAEWQRPDFAATGWARLDQSVLAGWQGPYRLRLTLELPAHPEPAQAVWISLRAGSSSWWDGALLGHNGRPGADRASEVPGLLDWVVPLDRTQATPGIHVLTIRASSFWHTTRFSGADFFVATGTLDGLAHAPLRNWLGVAVAFGGMLAALAFFAVLVRRSGPPRRAALLLLALGGVALLLLLVESARTLFGYTYPLHAWRLRAVVWLTLIAALLLPAYLASRLQVRVPGRTWWLAGAGGVLLVIRPGSFDLAAMLLHLCALLAALAVLSRATPPRAETRAREWIAGVLLACLAALCSAPAAYLDLWYFVGVGGLLVMLLAQHATLLAQAREQARRLDAERARLEAELLKQSMQPHWLMNTLTALQELIELQPAQASRMVEALGREFALLRRLSGHALIALSEELDLCRVHLEIMSMARLRSFRLTVTGDSSGISVPPGLLHTLVENGLTHGGLSGDGDFALQIDHCAHGVVLRLRVPYGTTRAAGSAAGLVSGLGTHYVRLSLQSRFPQAHRFTEGVQDGRWCSTIGLGPTCAC